ncbi:hypothetical protein AX14_004449 [Amanita brunnescens Koide BX004]|nr:hypothetical protein AX14_004449 [Amanita brunnescens Koide BX004]
MTRANIEELTYEDEHKFKNCSPHSLSLHTNAHSSDSTRLKAIQMSHKGSRSTPSLTNDEKVHEDKHWQICSFLPLSSRADSHSSDLIRPKAIHLGHQVPAQLVEVLRDMSPNMAVIEQPELGSVRESPTRDTPEANKEDTSVYDT